MKNNFCKYLVNERTPDEGFAQSCHRKDKHFITVTDEEKDCTRDIMCDHYDNSKDLTVEERIARLETAINDFISSQDDTKEEADIAQDTECEDKDMCDGDCHECRNGE